MNSNYPQESNANSTAETNYSEPAQPMSYPQEPNVDSAPAQMLSEVEASDEEILSRYLGAESIYRLKDEYDDIKENYLVFRSPMAGDLRGLSVGQLSDFNVDQCTILADRICMNRFPRALMLKLTGRDFIGLGATVVSFLS